MLGMTWRRSLVRAGLRALAVVPARRGTPMGQLPGLSDAEEILHVVGAHTSPWRAVAVYWPPQADRGRAYLHLLDGRGNGVAFLKLAVGEDAPGLGREETALLSVDGGSVHYATPRVRASGTLGSTRWLCMEPLPPIGRQTLKPRLPVPVRVIDDIRGEVRTVPPGALEALTWWADLQRRLDTAPAGFVDDLHAAVALGLQVCRAHGDFAAHNLAQAEGRLWVFDWENFAVDAPVDQDVVSFRLARGDALADVSGPRGEESFRRFVACCAFGLAHDLTAFETIVTTWAR
jgi:hypothetical protein